MRRRGWPGLLWLLAAAAAGALLTLSIRRGPGPQLESVHLTRQPVEQTLVLRGRLQRAVQVEVRPSLAGWVVAAPPEIGQHVKEGERVLSLRADSAFVAQVEEALSAWRDARFAVRRLERVPVRSAVAGRLLRFDAAAGSHVGQGQTVATVESEGSAAGKAEHPVTAPVAGQLLPFVASPGAPVSPRDELPLVFLIPEQESRDPRAFEAAAEPLVRAQQAEAQLRRLAQTAARPYPSDQLPVDRAFVLAPLEGEVTWRASGLAAGTPIRPDQRVLALASRERIVLVRVHEVDYPVLQAGQAVTITFDASPDRTFPARLSSKSHTPLETIYDQFSEYDAVFSLSVPPDLVDGMSCNVVVAVGSRPLAASLPISALVRGPGQGSVWVRRSDRWELVPVQTGLVGDLRVEILGGVTTDDEVALKPAMVPPSERSTRSR